MQIFDDGGRIFLRELQPEDVNAEYLSWFQDATVTKFLDAKGITREEAVEYMLRGRETREFFMYAILVKDTGLHIGNVKVGPIQWPHLISDLVTVIGRKEFWGTGIASEAIKLGNRVAFEFYGMRKLSGGIAEGNVASLKAYKNAGWVVEALLRGHHLIDGQSMDRIVVSCFNPKFFGAHEAE
jgi:ribosomal-protein-alanine N-acetyltransferase